MNQAPAAADPVARLAEARWWAVATVSGIAGYVASRPAGELEHSVRAMMARLKCGMRTAAFAVAVERVKNATDLRGLG